VTPAALPAAQAAPAAAAATHTSPSLPASSDITGATPPGPGDTEQRSHTGSTTSVSTCTSQSSVKTGYGSATLSRAYFNIKAARDSTRAVRMPKGLPSKNITSIGSFSNDEIFNTPCNYRHNYAAKQNISTSFDLKDFHCLTCTGEGHVVLHREGERVEARELAPVAFVLSDQNFAPSLPVEEGGNV
jgi:hypothetical protein